MARRIVFDPSKWEEQPTVVLDYLLRKESWFNGTTNLTAIKNEWETQRGFVPNLFIKIPYLGKEIKIDVHWTTKGYRNPIQVFNIYENSSFLKDSSEIDTVYSKRKRPRRRRTRQQSHSCTSYDKAIDTIMDIVELCIPNIDKIIEEEEKKKRQEILKKQAITDLSKALGDKVFTKDYNYEAVFRSSTSYWLGFNIDTDKQEAGDPDIYNVGIHADFTLEETVELAKIVATNPRCIAERLRGKQ